MQVKVKVISTNDDAFVIVDALSQAGASPKGQHFINLKNPNPLETFLASVAVCAGVHTKRYLKKHNVSFSKLDISVSANLCRELPMRLKDINVEVDTDAEVGDKRDEFDSFIHNCPVHNTLLHTKEVNITLI
jgi:putative redox protein